MCVSCVYVYVCISVSVCLSVCEGAEERDFTTFMKKVVLFVIK